MAGKQAILFLTHRADQRVIGHFERLRQETAHLMPCFLCVDAAKVPETTPADFRFELLDAWRVLPERLESVRHDVHALGGCELYFVPLALLTTELEAYESFWIVEYDADFAGPWSHVFGPGMTSRADLIGAHLFSRMDEPDWMHWPAFVCPPDIPPEQQIKGLFCVSRFSRHLLELYVRRLQGRDWLGNFEAIVPTLALHAGLRIGDLSTRSPFGSPDIDVLYEPESFHCLEPRRAYFHETPESFPERGLLYHPVKVAD